MSTWTTPATTATGSVTSAFWNTEVRDHASFLKGALDLLTNTTTADTGTTMYLQVRRTASTDAVFEGQVGAEANPRIRVTADGKIAIGPGGSTAPDTSFERLSSSAVRIDGANLQVRRAAVATQYFTGIVTGDAAERVGLDSSGTGNGGRLAIGDGTTAGLGRVFWDTTNTRLTIQTTANGVPAITSIVGAGGSIRFGDGTAANSVEVLPSSTPAIQFATAAGAMIRYTAAGHLEASGRFTAADGVTHKVKAGTISDGDYTHAAESGLMGLDSSTPGLWVRVGSTWRMIEVYGALQYMGPYVLSNLPGSATTEMGIGILGNTLGGTPRIVMPYAGSVVGISIRSTEARTAGTATAQVTNGGVGGTLTAQLNGTDTFFDTSTQSAGVDTFAIGDGIGVQVVTASWTPTTADLNAYVWVLARR